MNENETSAPEQITVQLYPDIPGTEQKPEQSGESPDHSNGKFPGDEMKLEESSRQTIQNGNDEKAKLANQRWSPYLVFCNVSIILGSSLTYGYNLGVINAPYAVMNNFLNETYTSEGKFLTVDELSVQWSLAVTLYLIGGFLGSIWVPAAMARGLGKRNALLVNTGIGIIGAVILFITPWTHSVVPLMIGRVLVGIQGGISMILAPDLIAEHAPARLRGGCGSLFTLGAPLGINITNLLGLNFILGQQHLWQYLFLVLLGLYLIHVLALFFVVESPIYLISKDKEQEALKALMKLRAGTADLVRPELEEAKQMLEAEKETKAIKFLDFFKQRQLWWPMIIVVNLGIVGEGTGLAAACFYATNVLEAGGLSSDISAVANFGLSWGITFGVALNIVTVDRFGRRLLMIGPLGMVCIANALLVIALSFKIFQLGAVGFALFLFFYGMGPGILPLYMTAEMFPQPARPAAYAVGMFSTWATSIIVSFVFPVMQLNIDQYSFLPFVGVSFCEMVFFIFFLPETSSRIVDYDPDRFAPGRTLLQLKPPPRKEVNKPQETNVEQVVDNTVL